MVLMVRHIKDLSFKIIPVLTATETVFYEATTCIGAD